MKALKNQQYYNRNMEKVHCQCKQRYTALRGNNELRTGTYNVRVGDKVWVDGQPAFSVKGGGNRFDVYTMKEMIAAFYGENCKCIIIKQSGRKVVIE